MNHKLEKYYSGHKKWDDFVNIFNGGWNKCPFKDDMLNELNDKLDIAIVVFGLQDKESLAWIHTKIPALDKLTPSQCTRSDVLLKRLKAMLMRMPM